MSPDLANHWPALPSNQDLTEEQAAALLEEIRAHAYAIHAELEAQGRYQCAADDWLAAEAEVFRLHNPKPAE